jgi:glucose/arabinose dehydrogenase
MKKITLLLCLFSAIGFAQTIAIQSFASGFSGAVAIENAGDDRLFVVQQGASSTPGRIRILNPNGTINTTDFLTLPTSVIAAGGERGLLGLAFHPNYAENGYFYVNYTRNGDGATTIARYSVSSDPNVADASSGTVLLTVAQPFSNHNGGSLRFGPDGYLYIGMGDGGSGNDPQNNAQNINSNLGKMLRIDVDSAAPYAIPSDNPYLGVAGNDEIWATGLRNPWKFSFDRETGDLWIADVGQNQIEEINKVTGNGGPGLNYGWRCYEGNNSTNLGACTIPGPYTFPVATYTHSLGCSITGGYVYRGSTYPNFYGKYFFTDYCTDVIGMVDTNYTVTYSANMPGSNNFTSFGEDSNGEMYITNGSTVFRLIDSSLDVNQSKTNPLSIFPNPASHQFAIHLIDASFPAQVTVYDVAGKQVLKQTLTSNTDNVKTSDLNTGLYLVNVQSAQGEAYQTKLSISHQ